MKLKAYHFINLTLLFLSVILDLTFLGLTIYHFVSVGSKVDDGIIYCVCFALAIAFTILEIINTFSSIKNGSRFVRYLVYDDANQFVNGVFIVTVIFTVIAVGLITYCSLIFGGLKILFSDLDRPMIYVAFSFGFLILVNTTIMLLFPLLGKEDKAMKVKRKKSRGYDM